MNIQEVINMKKSLIYICCTILLMSCVGCKDEPQPAMTNQTEDIDDYAILANGVLQINKGNQTTILEINALSDCQIIQDEYERLLILTDPSDQYQHGILGDKIEPTSVTIVQLSDQPSLSSRFSVPEGWVIESISPIWSDWDGDGQREIVLTLSNREVGAKLVLFDENGTLLAESAPIGQGNRWRHALDIAAFGENGAKLLADVVTPHIGGIASFYSWDKENKVLKSEATLPGYSTHDIGSRDMGMYTLMTDEQNGQVLLIVPNQSKTELVALRFSSRAIQEEWRLALGGRLSADLELLDNEGTKVIRAIINSNQEVLLDIPE